MLSKAIDYLFHILFCSSIDIMAFLIVDSVTKIILSGAQSEASRKLMWLYEVLFLSGAAALTYYFHHMPYILAFLTSTTFVSTQFFGRVCLGEWWMAAHQWWDEHEQMRSSMYDSPRLYNQPQYPHNASLVTQKNNPSWSQSSSNSAHLNQSHNYSGAGAGYYNTGGNYYNTNSPPNTNVQQIRHGPVNPAYGPVGTGSTQNVAQPRHQFTHQSYQPHQSHHTPMRTLPPTVPRNINNPLLRSSKPIPITSQRSTVTIPFTQTSSHLYTHMGNLNNHGKINHNSGDNQQENRTTRSNRTRNSSAETHGGVNKNNRRPPQSQTKSTHNIRNAAAESNEKPYNARNVLISIMSRVIPSISRSNTNVHLNHPQGLQNDNNICFINAVLQCLVHTPGLSDKLKGELNKQNDCSRVESVFFKSFVTLLQLLDSGGSSGRLFQALCEFSVFSICVGVSVLKTAEFLRDSRSLDAQFNQGIIDGKEAASELRGSLVSSVRMSQMQQDASEFTLWLLSTLGEILKKNTSRGHQHEFTSEHLENVRSVYGELTPTRLRELIAACKREIALSNANDLPSYQQCSERLADLEWLDHKRQNSSVIDELFSGQIIEARHCLVDLHMSIETQPFKILSLPIDQQNDASTSITLDHCFNNFCEQESLYGVNGVQCTMCNNNTDCINRTPQTRLDSRTRHSTTDSLLGPDGGSFSPIVNDQLVNDSGYYDSRFKTSTPITDQSNRTPSRVHTRLRDARRRCLLRQLPDILIVQLSRFDVDMNRARKKHTPVRIPIHDLILDNKMYNSEHLAPFSYDLYSFCVHLGGNSTDSGHYVSYCQVANGVGKGDWYRFDDDRVTLVNISYELTAAEVQQNSYLLFYRRSDK